MFQAVERYLTNIAGLAGTLLLLDDLQWAGADALELLTMLVRTTATPLRVVGAYRDTEVTDKDPLAVTLADLAHAGLARQHTLAPLAAEEVKQLLASLLEDMAGDQAGLAARVAQRAGGVPFCLLSCVQAVRRNPLATGEQTIPWDVAQGIRQRVAALPTSAREVLGAAALVGRLVPVSLLTRVVEQPEPTVLVALDAACQARLLQASDAGFEFIHDLIQEVVEAGVGPARRMTLHRRIAETWEQLVAAAGAEPPLAVIAYHYGRSDAQEKALLYLEQAGDHASAQYANVAAIDFFRELVTRLDGLQRAADAARVREKLGTVLYTMAHFAAALEVLERAAETIEAAGDLEGLGRVMAQIGLTHAGLETLDEGISRLRPLLELLEARRPTRNLAALYSALGELLQMQGKLREALPVATRAAEIARELGDDRLLARAQFLSGRSLLWMGGHDEEGLPVVQEASRLAEETGDLEVYGWALLVETLLRENRGEFILGRLCATRALEVGERLGNPPLVAASMQRLGALAFFSGEWAQANTYFQNMTSYPERTVDDAMPRSNWGACAWPKGHWIRRSPICRRPAPSQGKTKMDSTWWTAQHRVYWRNSICWRGAQRWLSLVCSRSWSWAAEKRP